MAKSAIITLTTAGADTGPFNLLSDVNSYTTPFETNIPKASLVGGYTSNVVPDAATIIRVQSSSSLCTNFINLTYPTTTTTTTTTSTTTTTTTVAYYTWTGPSSFFGDSGSACSGYSNSSSYYSPQNSIINGVTMMYLDTNLANPVETTGNYLPLKLNDTGTIYTAVYTLGTASFSNSCP